jgi:hypothetical protein
MWQSQQNREIDSDAPAPLVRAIARVWNRPRASAVTTAELRDALHGIDTATEPPRFSIRAVAVGPLPGSHGMGGRRWGAVAGLIVVAVAVALGAWWPVPKWQ